LVLSSRRSIACTSSSNRNVAACDFKRESYCRSARATSAPDGELSGLFFFVDEFQLPGEYTEGENFIGVGDVFGDGELVFVPGDNFFPGDVFR
jgi:hypothetical protein